MTETDNGGVNPIDTGSTGTSTASNNPGIVSAHGKFYYGHKDILGKNVIYTDADGKPSASPVEAPVQPSANGTITYGGKPYEVGPDGMLKPVIPANSGNLIQDWPNAVNGIAQMVNSGAISAEVGADYLNRYWNMASNGIGPNQAATVMDNQASRRGSLFTGAMTAASNLKSPNAGNAFAGMLGMGDQFIGNPMSGPSPFTKGSFFAGGGPGSSGDPGEVPNVNKRQVTPPPDDGKKSVDEDLDSDTSKAVISAMAAGDIEGAAKILSQAGVSASQPSSGGYTDDKTGQWIPGNQAPSVGDRLGGAGNAIGGFLGNAGNTISDAARATSSAGT